MKKIFKQRRKSRKLILQCLYNWEISKNEIINIKKYALENNNIKKIDLHYFNLLIKNIPIKINIIDEIIKNTTENEKEIILFNNIIELNIIRIALYELLYCKNIPYKVIIYEALNLSILFSSKSSYNRINKILNIIYKSYNTS